MICHKTDILLTYFHSKLPTTREACGAHRGWRSMDAMTHRVHPQCINSVSNNLILNMILNSIDSYFSMFAYKLSKFVSSLKWVTKKVKARKLLRCSQTASQIAMPSSVLVPVTCTNQGE